MSSQHLHFERSKKKFLFQILWLQIPRLLPHDLFVCRRKQQEEALRELNGKDSCEILNPQAPVPVAHAFSFSVETNSGPKKKILIIFVESKFLILPFSSRKETKGPRAGDNGMDVMC